MKKEKDVSCWVITEGMAGTENQCLGVAEQLKVVPKVIQTGLNPPWSVLSPWLGFETKSTFQKDLTPPWPDILLTSGRKAIAAARYIKKQSNGTTFTVYIQDPRVSPSEFDLVAVPYHDPTRGENVIVTDFAPNRINDETLSKAQQDFLGLAEIQGQKVAVLIGGKSKAHDMPTSLTQKLIADLKRLQIDQNISLMITASRRTGDKNMALLKEAFINDGKTYFWDGKGENPYIAFLAYADYILVTEDSVSMISDAVAAGKPTYIIEMDGGGKRIDIFHKNILEKGYVKRFKGTLELYPLHAIREAENIAKVIRNKMGIENE